MANAAEMKVGTGTDYVAAIAVTLVATLVVKLAMMAMFTAAGLLLL